MKSHSSHWGAFRARWRDGALQVLPHPADPDPNRLIDNLPGAIRNSIRVSQPMVRRGWLENGPGPDAKRGRDEFVPMPWDEVLDRLAVELKRVGDSYGASAIFGGSYGWSSAGRFHHAQSQVHRFLNTVMDGYVRSVNTYSAGASAVILPHVLGPADNVARRNVTWEQIIDHTDVVLAFGGMAIKNTQVASGGVSRHVERDAMRRAADRGCRFICVSPLRDDLPPEARAEWLALKPLTDTALMLGIAHTLVAEGLHDEAFIEGFCAGWAEFEQYLLGRGADAIEKSAAWAGAICGISEAVILDLARSLAKKRVLVTTSLSLQRSEHGEQPIWMAAVLAAMLGQLGLPGGGLGYALGSLAHYGKSDNVVAIGALPQGENHVSDFIPVARIADMLLKPGDVFDYNGQRLRYPHIRLAYWAGGNPFHHHQDLGRLAAAVGRLDTFVVHEIAWTATARHADIVLPSTMTLEREDIAGTPTDPLLMAMHRVAEPYGQARDDYEIFADLAERLGRWNEFTEGRTSRQWIEHMYEEFRTKMAAHDLPAPSFEEFWERGELELPKKTDDGGMLRAFRENPVAHPLPTPSGKVQISSAVIQSLGYASCPGHPAWLAPTEPVSAEHPLYLIANQPRTRLHSQFDFGDYSRQHKRRGREVCSIHPSVAAVRGIADGDIVKVFNRRGVFLACAEIDEGVSPDVLRVPTGAWYDPVMDENGRLLCVHGNPNVLTRDIGTSSLAQGCSGQVTAVEIERYTGSLPPIRAFISPEPSQ
ncbi:molybdopterin-dependent oxidoreductase [Ferrovibrio xuzhouensis]|uniref:Molybdopterin-dependent oxidoreductase n=1 Tax=Ferrovibrio xuzhouensis TaxID=1576914 RepID=A0ABV7VM90_9PROT